MRSIVELGLGCCRRAVRMIQVASWGGAAVSEIRYTGVDLFEGRPVDDPRGLTLKMAHRIVRKTGARVQLLPGDPYAVLSRAANGLAGTDLLVISEQYDPHLLAPAWFYVPRMLHVESMVFVGRRSRHGGARFDRLGREEIQRLAAGGPVGRAA